MERDEVIFQLEDDFDLSQEDAEEVWLYVSQESFADSDAKRSEAFEQDTRRRREAFAAREAELRHERISVMAQNVKVCRGRMLFVCQY